MYICDVYRCGGFVWVCVWVVGVWRRIKVTNYKVQNSCSIKWMYNRLPAWLIKTLSASKKARVKKEINIFKMKSTMKCKLNKLSRFQISWHLQSHTDTYTYTDTSKLSNTSGLNKVPSNNFHSAGPTISFWVRDIYLNAYLWRRQRVVLYLQCEYVSLYTPSRSR